MKLIARKFINIDIYLGFRDNGRLICSIAFKQNFLSLNRKLVFRQQSCNRLLNNNIFYQSLR
jgi:hypothetical protein